MRNGESIHYKNIPVNILTLVRSSLSKFQLTFLDGQLEIVEKYQKFSDLSLILNGGYVAIFGFLKFISHLGKLNLGLFVRMDNS